MKKLLILVFLSTLLSCAEENKEKAYTINEKIPKESINSKNIRKFRRGDIVYLKPDSLRCIVTYINVDNTVDISYYIAEEYNSSKYISLYNFY